MSAGYLILMILAGLAVGGSCGAAADNPTEVRSDDGYVIDSNTQTGDREWTLGTSRAQKTLTLRGGSFLLTSFLNKGTSPPKEYIQGPPSPEFRVPLDGKQITGADGSWVCKASSIQKLAQGEIQLEIVLAKAPLLVTKRYIVYPGCSIIREQITYKNTGKDAVKITNPSFLDASVMAQDIKGGLSFGYFTGGAAGEGSQMLVIEPVKADYSRTFKTFGSAAHLPLMILWDKAHNHGISMGWDYLGPWTAPIGTAAGEAFHLGLCLDDFSRTLKPGESVVMPMAFLGAFTGDLDDLGNDNLDWQYRYLWQHKKPEFFARPRYATEFDGPWWLRCGTEELWSRRLAMDLYIMEFARYVGAGILWNDAAWYDEFGNWNGPDWAETHKYVKKHEMEMLIWVWSAVAFPGSKAEQDMGEILTDLKIGPPYLNQSTPEATDWQLDLLSEKIKRWGNFQWRYDFATALGPDRLAADQQFRRLVREFTKAHPDSAIDTCMGGGNGLGYDLAETAQTQQMSDGGTGDTTGYFTSMILPPDMLYDCFTIIGSHNRRKYDIRNDRVHMRMLPVWLGDPGSEGPYQGSGKNQETHYRPGGEVIRPEAIASLEAIRKDWDLHKYLLSQNVIGRWSHVFRPEVQGDNPHLYFQRMDREGTKGFIVTNRAIAKPADMPAGPITIKPKGLKADLTYTVTFDLAPGSESRTGAELMANGIGISNLQAGEIVFFNLPNRPGSGADKEVPTAPTGVTQRITTNVFTQGIEVTWKPSSDNNWLSCYEVFRIGIDGVEKSLGKVAQGSYYFDRSALASDLAKCRYSVQAVDGDGNVSIKSTASTIAGESETHYAFSGYGPEQGWRGWNYQVMTHRGDWRELIWQATIGYEGLWADELNSCWIGRTLMHPCPSQEIARVFEVKRGGPVTLKGTVKKDPTLSIVPSKTCRVRIMKNEQQVWPASGWQTIPTKGDGVKYAVKITVKPGDRILHVMQRNPDNNSADIAWNPVVQY